MYCLSAGLAHYADGTKEERKAAQQLNTGPSEALQGDNFTMALGEVEEGGRHILVRALARFAELDDVR